MKATNKNETILIKELRRGSVEAFDALYELYFNKVYAYSLQISKSEQKATDITQDVFLKLWETRQSIKTEKCISPYLFRIARNHLVSAYRETANSITYQNYVRYNNSIEYGPQPDIEYEEFLRKIRECLSKMPESQRKIVEMSRFKTMSNKEIAAALGLSEQTVKNRLVMGIKFLRDFLGEAKYVLIISSASEILKDILQA